MAEERIYPWGDARRFNAYSSYFKKRYGGRVQKVAINAGFTCPNRDGSKGRGGCTYCNNEAFNPSYCDPAKSVRQQIEEGILFHAGRYRRAHRFLAYFQAFSNTYKPLEELRRIYEEALACEGIVGIGHGQRVAQRLRPKRCAAEQIGPRVVDAADGTGGDSAARRAGGE